MKRLFLGMIWFLLLFVCLWLLTTFGLVIVILRSLPANADSSAILQAASDYAAAHAETIRRLDLAVLIVAAVLSFLGTLKGKLPGTRKAQDRSP